MSTQLLPFGRTLNKKAIRVLTFRCMATPVFFIACAVVMLAYNALLLIKGYPMTISLPSGLAVLVCGILNVVSARTDIRDMHDDELVVEDGALLFIENNTGLVRHDRTTYRIVNVSNIKVRKGHVDVHGEIIKEKEKKISGTLRMISIPAIYGTPQNIAMVIREYAGTR